MRAPAPSVCLSLAKLIVPVHSLGRHGVEAFSMFSVEVSFKFTLPCICYMDFVNEKKSSHSFTVEETGTSASVEFRIPHSLPRMPNPFVQPEVCLVVGVQ